MVMTDCFARTYCKKYGDEGVCQYGCIAYHQMNTIYSLSNLPKKYQQPIPLVPDTVDLDAFRKLKAWTVVEPDGPKFIHHVLDKVKGGQGLFIWSTTKGNGKTSWATKILHAYFRAVGVWNTMKCRGLYVNVAELLDSMRSNMDKPDEKHLTLMRRIRTADVVIFDDIGTESPTKWVREQLYIIINKRYSDELVSIFTSNASLDTLADEDKLGDRIASRIAGSCDQIQLRGGDNRYLEGE